ncbi:MAG TPA: sigma-E factor negative regulatory protein [Burkholderiales bacterium]
MRDRISEFMDGELGDQAAGGVIEALGRDDEARDAWRTYHLIGDTLRDSTLLSAGFTVRVARQLAAEPTVVAPGRLRPQPRTWYALAASVAAVALVGWLAFAPQQSPVAPVAQQQAPAALAKTKPALVPLPSGANDYLLAHQAYSPRVSLQGMAPYVRTVSEQVQESRK